MRVALLAVYIGKLPQYYPLWEQSAMQQREIDFYVFTDDPNAGEGGGNIHIINLDMPMFKNLIRIKLQIEVDILPYKICDYKPCFGKLFEDYLVDYDWWGVCDLDLIWGDIKQYCCNDYILENYDQAFGRGHLSIYKNPEMSQAYKLKTDRYDYLKLLKSPYNFAFDEWRGIIRTIQENGYRQYFSEVCADISFSKYALTLSNAQNYKYQAFLYDHGRIYQLYLNENLKVCCKEFAYIHLQKRKFQYDENCLIVKKYFITPNGTVPWKHISKKKDFIELNPRINIIFTLKYIKWRIKNKFNYYKKRQNIKDEKLKNLLL